MFVGISVATISRAFIWVWKKALCQVNPLGGLPRKEAMQYREMACTELTVSVRTGHGNSGEPENRAGCVNLPQIHTMYFTMWS